MNGVVLCTVRIDDSKCNYCLDCVHSCPTGALIWEGHCFEHDGKKCMYCEVCSDVCMEEAIRILEE